MELHNLCGNADILRVLKSRKLRWAGHVVQTGDVRRAHKIIVGKSEGKRPHDTKIGNDLQQFKARILSHT